MKPADKFIEYNGRKYGGYKKCPKWLKDVFRRSVNYICMDCNKHEEQVGKLEPHRQKRGVDNGLYMCVPFNHPLCNVRMLCHNCHKSYNYSRRNNYQNTSKSLVFYK
jgi:hypothetical protein